MILAASTSAANICRCKKMGIENSVEIEVSEKMSETVRTSNSLERNKLERLGLIG